TATATATATATTTATTATATILTKGTWRKWMEAVFQSQPAKGGQESPSVKVTPADLAYR
ncbi:MAG TPA: hypothetical protein VLJ17_22145, partial [Xanthobacteraceae bacterium]|nr:hypothetical protein [Xanthobacteraceae bacterium]